MTLSSAGRKVLLIAAVVLILGVLAVFLRKEGGVEGGSNAEGQKVEVPTREWTGGSSKGDDEVYRGSVRVEAVLADESIPDREVRDALLEIAKDGKGSAEERAEALAHALILTPDEDTDRLKELISESAWPNGLLEDFFDDAMLRPDPGRLGLMVEIMIRAKPPLRTEVEETLGFLLDQELGEDFEAWRDAVNSWTEEESG